jgi:hypothetical protein
VIRAKLGLSSYRIIHGGRHGRKKVKDAYAEAMKVFSSHWQDAASSPGGDPESEAVGPETSTRPIFRTVCSRSFYGFPLND